NVPATTMAIDGFECCSSKARSRGPAWQITSRTRQAPPSAITRLQSWPAQCACTWSAEAELDLTAIFAKTPSSQNDTTTVEAPEADRPARPSMIWRQKMGSNAVQQETISMKLIIRWEQVCR